MTRGRNLANEQQPIPSSDPSLPGQAELILNSSPSMGSLAKHMLLCHTNMTVHHSRQHTSTTPSPPADDKPAPTTRRWAVVSTALAASSMMLGLRPASADQSWGTRSFISEKYFQPGLSPEEAVDRIRQTAEGMKGIRQMLETMSWRYVLYYIRLKADYLDADLRNAVTILPENRRPLFVKAANELVDNMAEFDHYVRTPKVYESYVYYEKTLKSLEDIVALLA